MTWPIPTLPTDWTNTTPQLDDHPEAHNALADGVNELAARVPASLALVPTAWTAATLLTGWTGSARYRLAGDLVYVQGRVTNSSGGALTNTSPILNLPAGHRPTVNLALVLTTTNVTVAFHLAAIESGGNLRPASGASIPNGVTLLFEAPPILFPVT